MSEESDWPSISQLINQVAVVFPDLAFNHARLEEGGGDNRLLILDERLAIRFPRVGTHDLNLEIAVLEALSSTLYD